MFLSLRPIAFLLGIAPCLLHGLEVEFSAPGHLFTDRQKVEMTFGGNAPVRYQISEVEGPHRASGTAEPGKTIALQVPNRGLYSLSATRGDETLETSFAVIYPLEDGVLARNGIFFTKMTPEIAANIARMGLTGARLNFWFGQEQYAMKPPTDPKSVEDGEIDFALNRGFIDDLLKAGIPAHGIVGSIEGVPPTMAIDGKYNKGPKDPLIHA